MWVSLKAVCEVVLIGRMMHGKDDVKYDKN